MYENVQTKGWTLNTKFIIVREGDGIARWGVKGIRNKEIQERGPTVTNDENI